jgi:hypothetical protein
VALHSFPRGKYPLKRTAYIGQKGKSLFHKGVQQSSIYIVLSFIGRKASHMTKKETKKLLACRQR